MIVINVISDARRKMKTGIAVGIVEHILSVSVMCL
jgi:hypothetical protein